MPHTGPVSESWRGLFANIKIGRTGMTALGQKRTFLPGQLNVRFTPKAVIRLRAAQWLLLTQSGHSTRCSPMATPRLTGRGTGVHALFTPSSAQSPGVRLHPRNLTLAHLRIILGIACP